MLFSALILGCTDTTSVLADTAAPIEEDTPAPAAPVLSADEVMAELGAALAAGMPDVLALRSSYFALLAEGDADCPGVDVTGFAEGCQASTGYAYHGVSDYEGQQQTDKKGTISGTWMLSGDFEIVTPVDTTFDAGGLISGLYFESGEVWASTTTIGGTWGYDALEGAVQEGVSASLRMTAAHEEVDLLNFEGTITVAGHSVGFRPLTVDLTGCDGLQVSELKVRGSSGYWYTVTFADGCSGCGTVTFYDGQEVGESCLDIMPLLQAVYTSLVPK